MSRQQIDFPIQQVQVATPASPPSGTMKLYPKTDNKFYQLTPAGEETVLGGGVSDPLTIGRIILTSGTDMAAPAITLNNGAYIGAKDNAGTIRPVLESTGDNWQAFHAGPNGLTFVNYINTVRVGTIDNGGNMSMSGEGKFGSLNNLGPSTLTGRVAMFGPYAGTIANAAGTGSMEIQTPSGGAALIAFHRPGVFATNFGLDTDNVFKVGGWSMGAVSYKVLDARDYSVAAASSKLVMRNSSGYIEGNYINLTADVAGGAPVYVAGQNGDNYLRWYPKAW